MCQRIGLSPMGTSGFGTVGLCSLIRVPRPPHRMIVGTVLVGTVLVGTVLAVGERSTMAQ
jgi:hypothetical protein